MNDATFSKKTWSNFGAETVDLPTVPDKHFVPAEGNLNDPAASHSAEGILVIDNITEGSNLVCFLLKKLNYSSDLVGSADLAISRLNSKSYELIFVNLDLFCHDNFQLLSSIALLEKKLGRQTPIIGMRLGNVNRTQKVLVKNSEILKAIINKASLIDVTEAINTFGNPIAGRATAYQSGAVTDTHTDTAIEAISPDLFEIPCDLVNNSRNGLLSRLYNTEQELEVSLSLLSGKIKTILSCLKLAVERKDNEGIYFLAATLQESCSRVGFVSIEVAADHMLAEVRENRWSRVAKFMRILNAQCNAAILQLQSASEFSR